MTDLPIKLRIAKPDDLNFILNSWLVSYRELDSGWAKSIPKPLYFDNHKKLIEGILSNSVTIIACDMEDPSHIYGYFVYQPTGTVTVLHYVYVKQPFRRLGMASRLFEEIMKHSTHKEGLPVPCSHAGRMFHMHLKKRFNLVFNPYVLGEELPSYELTNPASEVRQ